MTTTTPTPSPDVVASRPIVRQALEDKINEPVLRPIRQVVAPQLDVITDEALRLLPQRLALSKNQSRDKIDFFAVSIGMDLIVARILPLYPHVLLDYLTTLHKRLQAELATELKRVNISFPPDSQIDPKQDMVDSAIVQFFLMAQGNDYHPELGGHITLLRRLVRLEVKDLIGFLPISDELQDTLTATSNNGTVEDDHQLSDGEIETLLAKLSPREQEMIRQRYIGNLPFEEIANYHGVTANNARQIVHRARKKLENLVKTGGILLLLLNLGLWLSILPPMLGGTQVEAYRSTPHVAMLSVITQPEPTPDQGGQTDRQLGLAHQDGQDSLKVSIGLVPTSLPTLVPQVESPTQERVSPTAVRGTATGRIDHVTTALELEMVNRAIVTEASKTAISTTTPTAVMVSGSSSPSPSVPTGAVQRPTTQVTSVPTATSEGTATVTASSLPSAMAENATVTASSLPSATAGETTTVTASSLPSATSEGTATLVPTSTVTAIATATSTATLVPTTVDVPTATQILPTAIVQEPATAEPVTPTDLVATPSSTAIITSTCLPAQVLQPLDIVLAIDISGSMLDDQKLVNAKSAAIEFVNALSTADRVSLVAFNNTATVYPTLTSDTDAVRQRIIQLTASGDTRVETAINTSASELMGSRRNPAAQPILILLSDGLVKGRDQQVLASAAAAQAEGIRIITIGVGTPDTPLQNAALLRQIANSEEDYHEAATSEELLEVYQSISRDLHNCPVSATQDAVVVDTGAVQAPSSTATPVAVLPTATGVATAISAPATAAVVGLQSDPVTTQSSSTNTLETPAAE